MPVEVEETKSDDVDEDVAVVEDADEKDTEPKTEAVTVEEWIHVNSQPPIWMRCVPRGCAPSSTTDYMRSDPKTVTEEEYKTFYQATFKDYEEPLAWHHFSGDSGSGVSFKAIIYVPSHLYVHHLVGNRVGGRI